MNFDNNTLFFLILVGISVALHIPAMVITHKPLTKSLSSYLRISYIIESVLMIWLFLALYPFKESSDVQTTLSLISGSMQENYLILVFFFILVSSSYIYGKRNIQRAHTSDNYRFYSRLHVLLVFIQYILIAGYIYTNSKLENSFVVTQDIIRFMLLVFVCTDVFTLLKVYTTVTHNITDGFTTNIKKLFM
jgi:hypothetical protein|uniref:Uncharacterized protein n=1 Tax=viral metagenome TaxID=1070528 RepID=A0A6C0JCM7_9ZZZZ